MSPVLLSARGVGKRFGGFTALDEVDVEVREGERLGLIGPNGSGKSTFVNCLAGEFPRHAGVLTFRGESLHRLKPHQRVRRGLARTFQLPRPFHSLSVVDNVMAPLRFVARELSLSQAAERAAEYLEQVGLIGNANSLPRNLGQVDLRKLELARAMATRPKLLIADEAMAGLSHSEVDQILELLIGLNRSGVAIIMIEHVMRAVTAFSERLVVFVAGRKVADGDPGAVLASREVEAAYLGD